MAVVMIVGDDPADADRIADLLEREGFAVARAAVPDDDAPGVARRLHARLHGVREPRRLQVGDLSVDLTTRQAWRGARFIELSPREFDLLAHVMLRAGEVVPRATLFEAVWHYRQARSSNVIEVHVARLRRKLDAPPIIHTVRGVGYVLSTDPR
jgi:two-component system OmpR family response regulator